MGFVGSYVWKLRQVLGSQRLLIPGVAMFIMTPEGKLWMGKRTDGGEWSYVGGGMELGQSIMDCVIAETHEEAGILTKAEDWTFVGLHTVPEETNGSYENGDLIQSVNHLFTMVYDGEITVSDDEHSEFRTFSLDDLPTPMKDDNEHAIALFKEFLRTGKVQVR